MQIKATNQEPRSSRPKQASASNPTDHRDEGCRLITADASSTLSLVAWIGLLIAQHLLHRGICLYAHFPHDCDRLSTSHDMALNLLHIAAYGAWLWAAVGLWDPSRRAYLWERRWCLCTVGLVAGLGFSGLTGDFLYLIMASPEYAQIPLLCVYLSAVFLALLALQYVLVWHIRQCGLTRLPLYLGQRVGIAAIYGVAALLVTNGGGKQNLHSYVLAWYLGCYAVFNHTSSATLLSVCVGVFGQHIAAYNAGSLFVQPPSSLGILNNVAVIGAAIVFAFALGVLFGKRSAKAAEGAAAPKTAEATVAAPKGAGEPAVLSSQRRPQPYPEAAAAFTSAADQPSLELEESQETGLSKMIAHKQVAARKADEHCALVRNTVQRSVDVDDEQRHRICTLLESHKEGQARAIREKPRLIEAMDQQQVGLEDPNSLDTLANQMEANDPLELMQALDKKQEPVSEEEAAREPEIVVDKHGREVELVYDHDSEEGPSAPKAAPEPAPAGQDVIGHLMTKNMDPRKADLLRQAQQRVMEKRKSMGGSKGEAANANSSSVSTAPVCAAGAKPAWQQKLDTALARRRADAASENTYSYTWNAECPKMGITLRPNAASKDDPTGAAVGTVTGMGLCIQPGWTLLELNGEQITDWSCKRITDTIKTARKAGEPLTIVFGTTDRREPQMETSDRSIHHCLARCEGSTEKLQNLSTSTAEGADGGYNSNYTPSSYGFDHAAEPMAEEEAAAKRMAEERAAAAVEKAKERAAAAMKEAEAAAKEKAQLEAAAKRMAEERAAAAVEKAEERAAAAMKEAEAAAKKKAKEEAAAKSSYSRFRSR